MDLSPQPGGNAFKLGLKAGFDADPQEPSKNRDDSRLGVQTAVRQDGAGCRECQGGRAGAEKGLPKAWVQLSVP